jgi:hypothetical protein
VRGVVDELAIHEAKPADWAIFGLDVDAGAGAAEIEAAPGVVALAIVEREVAAADERIIVARIVVRIDAPEDVVLLGKREAARRQDRAGPLDAVALAVVHLDVVEQDAAGIVEQVEAIAADLVAGVAELPAEDDIVLVAVDLEVADADEAGAIVDRDECDVGGRGAVAAGVGQCVRSRVTGRVECAVLEAGSAFQRRAIALDDHRVRAIVDTEIVAAAPHKQPVIDQRLRADQVGGVRAELDDAAAGSDDRGRQGANCGAVVGHPVANRTELLGRQADRRDAGEGAEQQAPNRIHPVGQLLAHRRQRGRGGRLIAGDQDVLLLVDGRQAIERGVGRVGRETVVRREVRRLGPARDAIDAEDCARVAGVGFRDVAARAAAAGH